MDSWVGSTGATMECRDRLGELQVWVDAVATGARSPLASARDGLAGSAVADAVIASMHDAGRTVGVHVPAADAAVTPTI